MFEGKGEEISIEEIDVVGKRLMQKELTKKIFFFETRENAKGSEVFSR